MTHRVLTFGLFALVGVTACGQMSPGPAAPQPVTFTVTARADAFSDDQPVIVRLYDAEQLAIAEQTQGCNVSFDTATGTERITCPEGVTYRPTTPEEFSYPSAQLAQGLVIASKSVTTGERYRLTLDGMAADDCNRAGAMAEGQAGGPTVELKNLDVAQTLMACP